MKETEIRDRIQGALGASSYPPDLTHRVTARLGEPPRRRAPAQLLGFVAALLAVAIVGTLVFVRLQSPTRPAPLVVPSPRTTPYTTLIPLAPHVPQADLDRAEIPSAGDLVTQLNLTETSNGRSLTLIGAYADPARTVLFFRAVPPPAAPAVMIYDDAGFLNASSTGGKGSFGDFVYALDAGPHAGPDGVAHLKVVISGLVSIESPAQPVVKGDWTFTFPLSLSGAQALTLNPPLTAVGTWKFTIETFAATPDLIHFQAVIDGAAVEDIKGDSFSLIDSAGRPRQAVTYSAGTTVPKSQITSVPPRSTRVTIAWSRAVNGGAEVKTGDSYSLLISGGGAAYRGTFSVPIEATKGSPPVPTDFPESNESLRIDGVWSVAITTGRPTACGAGGGPSGTVFAFATFFQVDQAWYEMYFSTDPSVRQYTNPGKYTVRGEIASYAPLGADRLFAGNVQLTVNSHNGAFDPWTGSVSGTLTWTGAATQPYTVNVSGTWRCVAGGNLGPG